MSEAVSLKENKMGTMPVGKLVISMSLPIMISMMVQALYNIVDTIFVSRVSEAALTALSMQFPIFSLMIAFGVGTTVGMGALLSRSLGEKNFEKVNKAATNGMFLAVCNFILFFIVGVFLVKPFYRIQTSDLEIVNAGISYSTILCSVSFCMFFQITFERLLQATGKTVYSMIVQLVGALVNIALDPVLIFGYFGLPKMGVAGAAVATVIGQLTGAVVGLVLNLRINKEVNLSLKGFKVDKMIIGEIYKVGVPTIIMQSIGSLMTLGMNFILITFSSTAVAVFGVYFRLQSFAFMPCFGLCNGLVPIISYNYGAQNRKRMIKAAKVGVMMAFTIMVVCSLLFEFFPDQLLAMFNAEGDMLTLGRSALKIIAIHFPLAAFGIVFGGVFQALGKAVYSMIMSICRQLLVLIPSAFILAKVVGKVEAVWWSFPIAEVVSLVLAISFMITTYKNIISKVGEKNSEF